jgi:ADP-ribosylglycohydrolase
MITIDKVKGVLYGQAIGDALGLGTEFMTDAEMSMCYPHGLKHFGDIVRDRHRGRWERGEWTDDTEMMLCIADGCTDDNNILSNIAHCFKAWFFGSPRGIGGHTYKVLMVGDYEERPIAVSKLIWEISGRRTAGNGGVMRTSIVGLFPKDVEEWAANICRLTHYDPRCVGSCVIVSNIIHSLVYDDITPAYEQIVDWGEKNDDRIKEYIDLAQEENLKALDLQDSNSMGFTLKTLAAALWAYWHATTFEEGLLSIVNAGGDADTNAAVACAILGAKFGFEAIPKEYVRDLVHKNRLEDVLESMMTLQGFSFSEEMVC